MMSKRVLLTLSALAMLASSCGPKAFVKGSYDKDVQKENLLTDQWSETDMQQAVKDLVGSMLVTPAIAQAKHAPLVMVTKLQNKTSEQLIDTQSIMDMVRVNLMK